MLKNVGSIKTWSAKMKRRHIKFCKQNTANADSTTWKLTLQDINTTLKELKTERDCSHRQLFRPLWHLDSCPPEDTWYGVILWVLRVLGQGLNQSVWIFFTRVFCVVTPYLRAPKRAKQLSMATITVCFEFVVVLMSCRVNFHVVRSALQYSACRILYVC